MNTLVMISIKTDDNKKGLSNHNAHDFIYYIIK